MVLESSEKIRSAIALKVAIGNGFDEGDPEVAAAIEEFSTPRQGDEAEMHAEALLQPDFTDQTGDLLAKHVWLLHVNNTGTPSVYLRQSDCSAQSC